jgi:hypothetical protein
LLTTASQNDTKDPHPLPNKASDSLLLAHAIEQVESIASNPVFANNTCAQCQAGLEVAKFLAMASPSQGPALAVALCHRFNFNSDCDTMFGILGIGAIVTQVVANADVGGFDGQVSTAAVSRCNEGLMIRIALDALPKLPQPLPAPTCVTSESYGLVCQAEAEPPSCAQEA